VSGNGVKSGSTDKSVLPDPKQYHLRQDQFLRVEGRINYYHHRNLWLSALLTAAARAGEWKSFTLDGLWAIINQIEPKYFGPWMVWEKWKLEDYGYVDQKMIRDKWFTTATAKLAELFRKEDLAITVETLPVVVTKPEPDKSKKHRGRRGHGSSMFDRLVTLANRYRLT
jgi:hypothetical protein